MSAGELLFRLGDLGIHLKHDSSGEHRTACPECDRGPKDTALAVRLEADGGATWLCHRCGFSGGIRGERTMLGAPTRPVVPPRAGLAWSETAEAIWRRSEPLAGSAAADYLRVRCCVLPPPDADLRYLPARGDHGPAMLARVTHAATGKPMSLHFTRLDGSEPRKLLLKGHRKAGGVVRRWPDDSVTTHLCLTEGLETALSAAWAYLPAWAAVDCGNLASFPVLPGVEVLVIAADHDPPGTAAAEACAARWVDAGREVVLWVPDTAGQDFNDVAREVA